MKLLEFITYCSLKGLIESKTEVEADWDPLAKSHWKIVIDSGGFSARARIAYAIVPTEYGDDGLIISSSLRTFTDTGLTFDGQASLTQIMDSILSSK